jgi:hypothetical protein
LSCHAAFVTGQGGERKFNSRLELYGRRNNLPKLQ